MVVHSPAKFEVRRPQGAAAGAAAAVDAAAEDTVPPSVLAAQPAAQPTAEADLLGGLDAATTREDDLAAWNGGAPPGMKNSIEVHADTHAGNEEEVKINSDNVTTRRGRRLGAADEDNISVVSDVTAPPGSGTHPPLNPFTPEWFAQIIGAAASAAATAAISAHTKTPSTSSSSPSPSSSSSSTAPRRLNERKVPDFWEDKPDFWFRIFDAHLAHFNPSERQCFDTLLPLLTPAARATVHAVVRSPGTSPYSKAREALLRHFGQTPRQQAREFRDARSMGDKLPTEFLDHLEALLPDVKVLFEVALLDALPANARVAALQHSDVRAMARAADDVVLENRALASGDRDMGVSSLSLLDSALETSSACQTPLSPSAAPTVAAVARGQRPVQRDSLCQNHKRWGRETYKCLAPASCKMRGVLKPRPAQPSSSPAASGNGKAGSQ